MSSEGHGGFIAAQPKALLGLLIALPYWLDCLKFSGNGQLSQMRRVAPLLERDLLEHLPDADHKRRDLTTALGIELPGDPLIQLHSAALGGEAIVNVGDHSRLGSLFNRFTADSNPLWAQSEL